MNTKPINLEDLKEQGIILLTRTTREGENGMQLELAINGSTTELLQAVTELLTQVVVRTAYEDGKLDPVLAEKRREAERQALTKEIERRVRAAQAKEEVMSKAEHYAAADPALAEMLTKLKEMN